MKEAVCCVVFSKSRSEVLMVKRRDIPAWVLPGGGVDFGEAPKQAAAREVQEESGYTVSIVRQVAKYTPVNRLTHLTHLFEGTIVEGSPKLGKETKEVAFFPVDALPKKMAPTHRYWIADALKNAPTIIEKPVEGASYWQLLRALCLHPLITLRYLLTKLGIHLNSGK